MFTQGVADHHEIQKMIQKMKLVGSASVEEKEDSEVKITEEAGISFPVVSSEQEVDPCPVTVTEKQKLCETASSCLQNMVTTATEKIGEPQEILSDKVDQECTKEVGVAAVLCESIEKHGNEVTVSVIKEEKEGMQEHHDKPCSKVPGNL